MGLRDWPLFGTARGRRTVAQYRRGLHRNEYPLGFARGLAGGVMLVALLPLFLALLLGAGVHHLWHEWRRHDG